MVQKRKPVRCVDIDSSQYLQDWVDTNKAWDRKVEAARLVIRAARQVQRLGGSDGRGLDDLKAALDAYDMTPPPDGWDGPTKRQEAARTKLTA